MNSTTTTSSDWKTVGGDSTGRRRWGAAAAAAPSDPAPAPKRFGNSFQSGRTSGEAVTPIVPKPTPAPAAVTPKPYEMEFPALGGATTYAKKTSVAAKNFRTIVSEMAEKERALKERLEMASTISAKPLDWRAGFDMSEEIHELRLSTIPTRSYSDGYDEDDCPDEEDEGEDAAVAAADTNEYNATIPQSGHRGYHAKTH
jgi:hypothetical protein